MTNHERYRMHLRNHLRTILRRFLADLDADGWQGSSAELLEWLESYRVGREFLPWRNALVREIQFSGADILAEFGFELRHRRSHKTRYLSIERPTTLADIEKFSAEVDVLIEELRKGDADGEQD